MKIDVTQDDIDLSMRILRGEVNQNRVGLCMNCPVALAMSRAFGRGRANNVKPFSFEVNVL